MAEFSDRDSMSKLDAVELSEEQLSAELSAALADRKSEPPPYASPETRPRPHDQFEDIELRRRGTTDTQMPRPIVPVYHIEPEREIEIEIYKPRRDKKQWFMIGAMAVLFAALVTVSILLGLTEQANAKCGLGPKTVTATRTRTSTMVSTVTPRTVTSVQVSTSIQTITATSVELLTLVQPTTVEMTDMETETATETATLVGITVLPGPNKKRVVPSK